MKTETTEIQEAVYDVIIYQTRIKEEQLKDNTPIPPECKYEVSADLSEQFDIELEAEDMEEINTVEELVTLVENKVGGKDDDG